jgi:hypothetical protein
MKKLRSLRPMLFLLLSCLIVLACSGEKRERTASTPSSEGDRPASERGAPPRTLSWAAIPVYPGASRVKRAVTTPVLEIVKAEYKKVEHRYYQTADAEEQVASFYLAEMPRKGWNKLMSMNFGGLSFLSSWQMEGGEIGVTITSLKRDEDEQTGFLIIKGQGKR